MNNPTYEADFWAIREMLDIFGFVCPDGKLRLEPEEGGYVITSPGGKRHRHLLVEYAIHHLLYQFYAGARRGDVRPAVGE